MVIQCLIHHFGHPIRHLSFGINPGVISGGPLLKTIRSFIAIWISSHLFGITHPRLEIILRQGTDFEMPEDDSWIELQEIDGIDVPTHPEARRVHYLITEALTIQEQRELGNIIMAHSQNRLIRMTEEAAEVAESFPNTMENSEGQEA